VIYGRKETGIRIRVLDPIQAGTRFAAKESRRRKRKPPAPRFNEATLLSAMENSDKAGG